MVSTENAIKELLQSTGITINGNNPGDIQVHNNHFYARVMKEGALGLGESYMDGWWDCENLDIFIDKIISANLDHKIKKSKRLLFRALLHRIINFQTKERAFEVGRKHYDLSFSLFRCMLDSRMNYTCGYWESADNLEDAERDKLELTCQKLLLKPGMTLLDIGCGWGGLAKYAAENYGVNVVGVTISKQQYEYAVNYCKNLPVSILFEDYRDIKGSFDRICSLGMFEHVGHLNYDAYMEIVHRCLNDKGIFLLHTIGNNVPQIANKWILKYIFPNGMLPSISLISKATEGKFVMEDWHNFGADYDKTLMAWQARFESHWNQLKSEYDERFHRMWNYYLLSCAGAFRCRSMQLWQIVFSKGGLRGGYVAPRTVREAALRYPDYTKDHYNTRRSPAQVE